MGKRGFDTPQPEDAFPWLPTRDNVRKEIEEIERLLYAATGMLRVLHERLSARPGKQTPLIEEIRNRRHDLGLTQHALAEQMGCSQATIESIEAGRSRNGQWSKKVLERLRASTPDAGAGRPMADRGHKIKN